MQNSWIRVSEKFSQWADPLLFTYDYDRNNDSNDSVSYCTGMHTSNVLQFFSATSPQITEGVKPTLSELEKFEDQPEGIDLEVVTETTGTVSQWIYVVLCCVGYVSNAVGYCLQCCETGCGLSAGKEKEHNLQAGDNVEVCEGELINLQGKILSVDGNKITIMPKHEDLKVLHLFSFFPVILV